ncbi:MAG: two-component regulator propeller domain-containing protein [Ferruginibacter sp.]
MRICINALLLFLSTFLVQPVNAQQQAYFSNLTEKDGLSNNRVTCFFKDKTGYMWIGTESGLNMYNGNSWKIYKPSQQKKNYLSNSFITDIQQDTKGNMWVCTRKGLNRIDVIADTTEIFIPTEDEANTNTIPNDLVWDAYPDNDTSVWIAADAKEFCHYNPVKKKFYYYDFRAYLNKNNIETQSSYHSVFRILPKSSTELWLATTDGIFSFNKQTGKFALQAAISLSEITFFYFDERINQLYCIDQKNILYSLDPSKKIITAVSLQRNKHTGKSIPPYHIDENLLFVPAAEGLAVINDKNEVLYFLSGNTGKENNLLPGKVNVVYTDRQHITWVGTMNGISKFIPVLNNNLNLSFPNNLSVGPNLSFKNFIYYSNGNEWFVASWKDNTIFVADNFTGKITSLQKPVAYRYDTCYAFYDHNSDSTFLLSVGSLLIFNYRLKEWGKIRFPPPYNNCIITNMAIDPLGNYWVTNMLSELFIYNPKTKQISVPSKEDIHQNATRCLVSDLQNNCMWIGTSGYGLIRYDFNKNKFELIETNNKSKTALHSYVINDIVPDGKGDIWVATFEGGLAKYKTSLTSDKGFTNYDVFSGLPDDNIYGVAADEKGGVWFTSINGIGHIGPDGMWKGLYNQQSGLPFSKFQQSIAVLPGGEIATVADNNFICFNPSAINPSYSYPVIINDIFINDTILIENNSRDKIQKFNYEQNVFTFNFSVLDFISPGAVEYYYMLEGLERDWVFAGKQHSIRYSKLPPGEYTFRIKARGRNGGSYSHNASFHFNITPPFWKKGWFISLMVLCIASFIYIFVRWRLKSFRAVEEEKLKLQQLNAEKYKNEMELEQIINSSRIELYSINEQLSKAKLEALRSQMNPHFIFNCINSIDALIQSNDKYHATIYLNKFAKLLRNILDSSKKNTVSISKDLETLQLYVELEKFRHENKFTISIEADEELLQDDYKVPPLIIQPFVENAILHGLRYRNDNEGKLNIKVNRKLNYIKYVITDNGVGRNTENRNVQKESVSYGIDMSNERVRLFNNEKNASVEIIDLFEKGKPAGTRVEVSLKIEE